MSVPQPLKHQDGKPRIFLVGFNKCGTTSFHDFFKANGIASVHWRANRLAMTMHRHRLSGHRPLLDGMEQWTAYTDLICLPGSPWGRSNSDGEPVIEACTYFRELHRDYPDALFILNTRDPFDWIRSRLRHDQGRFAHAYMMALAEEGIHTEQQLCRRWLRDWHSHHSAVLDYFEQEAPAQFLIFHLEHSEQAELMRFLAPHFTLTTRELPHHHQTAQHQGNQAEITSHIDQADSQAKTTDP